MIRLSRRAPTAPTPLRSATPSPPPPPPPLTVAQRIDARFRLGRPSPRSAEAGVLVHVSDGLEDNTASGRLWDVGVDVVHMSASLINAHVPRLYSGGSTPGDGLVLSPETPLLCVWDRDMGTQSMSNRGCGFFQRCDNTPGAQLDGPNGERHKCSWRPSDLATMLLWQKSWDYNEVIISAIEWQRSLPWLVEAFVFLHGIHGATPEGERRARRAQRAFAAAFCEQHEGKKHLDLHGAGAAAVRCAGGTTLPPVLRFTGSAFEEV